ncbi:MAG: hypothetical protein IJ189_01590, partial [Clostridia bacterium]|nr:hypothetical protein [Clostridia bacterium]
DDETFENNVDIAFRELGERNPNYFAVLQWRKYKLAAGVTLYIRHLTYVIIKGMITLRKEPDPHENTHHYCLV